MNLDPRQRAMLREMGIRVWQPLPDAAPAPGPVLESALAVAEVPAVQAAPAALAPVARPSAGARPAADKPVAGVVAADTPLEPQELPAGAAWQFGAPLALYALAAADAASTVASGPRWLVLTEVPAAALQTQPFEPFEGDAGKLLDNMLRAAKLHQGASVTLAPLARYVQRAAPGTSLAAIAQALPALLASTRPDLVLVMGRMAAQALLGSQQPFGKLRGQLHQLHGITTVVTHDAAYLLRTPTDKAKAWDDLCLALSTATPAKA